MLDGDAGGRLAGGVAFDGDRTQRTAGRAQAGRAQAGRAQAGRAQAGCWKLLHTREMAVVKETGLIARVAACLGAVLIALGIAALATVDAAPAPEAIAAVSLATGTQP